jgi:hypothetical protein
MSYEVMKPSETMGATSKLSLKLEYRTDENENSFILLGSRPSRVFESESDGARIFVPDERRSSQQHPGTRSEHR